MAWQNRALSLSNPAGKTRAAWPRTGGWSSLAGGIRGRAVAVTVGGAGAGAVIGAARRRTGGWSSLAGGIRGTAVAVAFGGSGAGAAIGAGGPGKVTTTPGRASDLPPAGGRVTTAPEVSARPVPVSARTATWPTSATAVSSRNHFIAAYPKDTGQETSFGTEFRE